jgi:hypothetical protein
VKELFAHFWRPRWEEDGSAEIGVVEASLREAGFYENGLGELGRP